MKTGNNGAFDYSTWIRIQHRGPERVSAFSYQGVNWLDFQINLVQAPTKFHQIIQTSR